MPVQPLAVVIISLVEAAVKEIPQLAASFQKIFAKPEPGPADWEAERQGYVADTYESLVPDSKIPPSPTAGTG